MTDLLRYMDHLREEEKSPYTIAKYRRDIEKFLAFCGGECSAPTKQIVKAYKKWLQEEQYKVASINSMVIAVNQYMRFLGHPDCAVKVLRAQKRIYSSAGAQLTREDYKALLNAASSNTLLHTMLQVFAGTGIRVSELAYFTVEAVEKGCIDILCKSKIREIVLQVSLREALLKYAESAGITSGPIFRTSGGKALDRSGIWRRMKALCKKAGVAPEKGYPHNFRKLFARTVFAATNDLPMLSDLLGHSNLNTTRLYIKTTKEKHLARLEGIDLF